MKQKITGRIVRVDWPFAIVKTADQVDVFNLQYYRISNETNEGAFPIDVIKEDQSSCAIPLICNR